MKFGTLGAMRPGESCVVDAIDISNSVRRRLLDMGLQPGTQVRCAFTAPSGTPMAFWVKDTLIALRKRDCLKVRVLCCE